MKADKIALRLKKAMIVDKIEIQCITHLRKVITEIAST